VPTADFTHGVAPGYIALVRIRTVAVRVLRAAAGEQPFDAALRWRGLESAGRPLLRIAHYGDCSWREMPLAHGVHTPPGYPLVAAERLAAQGFATEFSTVVANQFEHLPSAAELEVHLKLTGDPDVVIVQLGTLYSRVIFFPDTPDTLRLRARIGRALGRRIFLGYRLMLPLLYRFGRFCVPYAGAGAGATFLAALRERWPHSRVAVLLPFPRVHGTPSQDEVLSRVRRDLAAVAAEAGVEVLDAAPLLPRDARHLRGANGYNLNAEGSALVGELVAGWVSEQVSSRAAA
jgi:hypothetical protein